MLRTAGALLFAALLLMAARADAVMYSTGGFENYTLGSVVGQTVSGGAGAAPNWQRFSAAGQPDPMIVDFASTNDPALVGRGKVLSVQPTGTTSGYYSGAFLPLGDLVSAGSGVITITFDQYRLPMAQELYVKENNTTSPSGWELREYGLNERVYAYNDLRRAPSLPLLTGVWQSVRVDLDYNTMLVSLTVDGQSVGPVTFRSPQPVFRGLGISAYATSRTPNQGPNYFDNIVISTDNGEVIPEPGTLALLGMGLLPLVRLRKK